MSDVSADLPQDVLSDILIRLPVKSIGRSRCVSKVWLSLLTSYDFTKAHLAHHSHSLAQEQKLLLFPPRSGPLFSLTLLRGGNHLRKLQFFNEEVFHLVGSCNGLVSVVAGMNDLWLINCLTEEYVKLPGSPFPKCGHWCFKKYGFRYDELSDDYTIVRISQCDYGLSEEPRCPGIYVDIYSLKMKSWRRLGTPLYGHDIINYDSCVFVNGAFHWIGLKFSSKESFVIGAFDLNCETFKEIPGPPVIEISENFSKLMVIDGCLGIIANSRYPGKDTDEIWYMKSYSVVESWTKLGIDIKPLCFHKGNFLFQKRNAYYWYCLKDGRVKVCMVHDEENNRLYFDLGITYSKSLVSPHFNSQN